MASETDISSLTHRCIEHDTHVLLHCEPAQPLLLVCDHASNRIPAEFNSLGLDEAALREHIAWDIGAGDVARLLAEMLHVPVVLASNSRLVVDCNRRLDDPTAFPAVSDGVAIPGNARLRDEDRRLRADRFYWPYHHAIRDQLRDMERLAPAPAVIAIHSFTPTLEGTLRPWHIGALWDKDSRLAQPFMAALREHDGIVVGDNQPYSGRHPADFTLDHHAEAEGLPHLGIELRQDLVADPAGVKKWSSVLAAALRPILEDPDLFVHRAGPI